MADPDDTTRPIGVSGRRPAADAAAESLLRAATSGSPGAGAPSDHGLTVGTRIGEFEVTGLVGQGGFGIVYRALDHTLQREVALKEYFPASLALRAGDGAVRASSRQGEEAFEAGRHSFINEARLLARFDHPSLIKVYRFWEANGTAYMVMPFYEGVTLKQARRARDVALDERELRALLAPLLDALEVVHAADCYHRDIAPDNILLLGDGRPVLLDFGAARRVIGDMTQALTVILKPGYAPIEQYDASEHLRQGPWTDLYAIGAVVHFCIAGRPPPASVGRSLNDSWEPLSRAASGRYSARFLAAVDHALALLPQQRPQSVAAFRDELGWSSKAPIPPVVSPSPSVPTLPKPSGPPASSPVPPAGKRVTPLVAAVGVLVVVAGLAAYLLGADTDALPEAGSASSMPGEAPPGGPTGRAVNAAPAPDGAGTPPPAQSAEPASSAPVSESTAPASAPPGQAPPPAASSPLASSPPAAPAPVRDPAVPGATGGDATQDRSSPSSSSARAARTPSATRDADRTVDDKRPAPSPSAAERGGNGPAAARERCAAVLNRAQLGEPMSAADLEYLKKECR